MHECIAWKSSSCEFAAWMLLIESKSWKTVTLNSLWTLRKRNARHNNRTWNYCRGDLFIVAIFYHNAEKLSDFITTAADLKIPPGPQSEKQQEKDGKRSKPERRRKEGDGKPHSAARHTFLGSSRFRRWNGATWKLCVCASAFMEFLKRKTKIK